MKKIIIFLLCLIILGCGLNIDTSKSLVINSYEYYDTDLNGTNYCSYGIKDVSKLNPICILTFGCWSSSIISKCNEYTIGDTIYLTLNNKK